MPKAALIISGAAFVKINNSEWVFLVGAIVMTIGLTFVATSPSSAGLFASLLHGPVHVFVYAMVAFAWARGLPAVPASILVLAGVALGFAHEVLEIFGHRHPFEIADACYDAAGVVVGVILARFPKRQRKTLDAKVTGR